MNGQTLESKPNGLDETVEMLQKTLDPAVIVVMAGLSAQKVDGIVIGSSPEAYIDEADLPPSDYVVISVPRRPSSFETGITVLKI